MCFRNRVATELAKEKSKYLESLAAPPAVFKSPTDDEFAPPSEVLPPVLEHVSRSSWWRRLALSISIVHWNFPLKHMSMSGAWLMVLEWPYDIQLLVYQVNSTSQTLLVPQKNQLFIFHIKLFPHALRNISHLITRPKNMSHPNLGDLLYFLQISIAFD